MHTSALHNKRVVITRSRKQAGSMIEVLERKGAIPILCPTIEIRGIDPNLWKPKWISVLNQADWIILTSVNAVNFFLSSLTPEQIAGLRQASTRIAVVGKKTAEALATYNLEPDFIPGAFVASMIPEGLGNVKDRIVLWPRGNLAGSDLADLLRNRGAEVHDFIVYETVPAQVPQEVFDQLSEGVDAVLFTSSSTVTNFMQNNALRTLTPATTVVACIGPVTANTAEGYGIQIHVVPDEHTIDGLLEALERYFERISLSDVTESIGKH